MTHEAYRMFALVMGVGEPLLLFFGGLTILAIATGINFKLSKQPTSECEEVKQQDVSSCNFHAEQFNPGRGATWAGGDREASQSI